MDPPDFYAVFDERPASGQERGRLVRAFGAPVETENRACLETFRDFLQNYTQTIFLLNDPSSGVGRNLACPAFMEQMDLDSRWQPEKQLGNALCYGGSFWNELVTQQDPKESYHARSFCCYDLMTGAFMQSAGTFHVGSFIQVKEFRADQDRFLKTCCEQSDYCELYQFAVPSYSIYPEYYDKPAVAYVRGDPHIGMPFYKDTIGHRQLTFNGIGEFTLLKSLTPSPDVGIEDFFLQDVNVQIRFEQRLTNRATVTTGIAIEDGNDDIVEIIQLVFTVEFNSNYDYSFYFYTESTVSCLFSKTKNCWTSTPSSCLKRMTSLKKLRLICGLTKTLLVMSLPMALLST